MDRKLIKQRAKIELARREFFFYCNLKAPDFYKPNRKFLVDLCNELQSFYEQSDYDVLIINEPPRHGKSRTAGCFVEWILGEHPEEKIMTGSYNETLSTVFSKNVRNTIQEEKADKTKVVYTDIFPDRKIKKGDGSMNLWSLEGGYNNYLATSPTGTATGFGASILIIDDLIKNAEEAYNESVKEKHWDWFTNTMLSRLEEGGKIIIIMTRWASDDLAGKALEELKELDFKTKHITMKAMQNDGTMLCDEILSKKSYELKTKAMGEDIASANYQQEPIDLKGALYKLKTYDRLPEFKYIYNYTDTADKGEDFLCSINYGVSFDNEAYLIDVLYTKEDMEITEKAQAKMMVKDKVNKSRIESNNGGGVYARNVERIMNKDFGTNHTVVETFHQSANKQARILSNSSWVNQHIYVPDTWRNKWPEFAKDVAKYQREGKNKHDDCADCLTGIAETLSKPPTYSFD
ncbi:MAG: phage terminase large subunit [Peptostreptococcus sp.]|uniref:phage terminase large subunit n=1 Tax=Peptostreptococcus sp. TaxID=1262 RepID=UPI00290BD4DE|nr:phage terminase large subunit [Peptostreptococcus sp.]MDU5680999.1 phage terminase large subunit [Peptostreptococcus sp.]MDU5737918.1 phage terminase large subunit [Peptostreptococcus sp.]